jgi:hypothetical protein
MKSYTVQEINEVLKGHIWYLTTITAPEQLGLQLILNIYWKQSMRNFGLHLKLALQL